MPYWHITLASRGRSTLFPTEAELRVGGERLAMVAGDVSLLFNIVDDHLHDVVEAPDFGAASNLSRGIRLALGPVARVGFNDRDIKPVETRAHLKRLVRYVLTQPAHHGLPTHSALWTGSSFLDLAGTRWLPSMKARLKDALPRLRWGDLLQILGLPMDPLLPISPEAVASLGLARLVGATSAALNANPALEGRRSEVVLARRSVVYLAKECGIRSSDLQRALGWSQRSVERYFATPVPEAILTAVRRRLALEELVSRATGTGLVWQKHERSVRGAG